MRSAGVSRSASAQTSAAPLSALPRKRVPSDTPWAPSASAAAIPRPSMMPPDATTGMPGPTASAICGTSDIVPPPRAAPPPKVPRWPPASLPCAITASAPASTARRASSTVVTIGSSRAPAARVASATGPGSSNVVTTVAPPASAHSISATGRIGRGGLGWLVGQAQLAPERQHDLEDARSLAGRRRGRRKLRIDSEGGSRAPARGRAQGHARGRRRSCPTLRGRRGRRRARRRPRARACSGHWPCRRAGSARGCRADRTTCVCNRPLIRRWIPPRC